jgi:hypothetical protein
MSLPIVILIGAVLGGLSGASIFFEPKEPYKWQILCAATLKGVLIALLTGFSVAATTRWWSAMIIGALYGFAFGLVIYLAKGGSQIRRRALCDPERNYHRRVDRRFYRHVGHQNDLITPNVEAWFDNTSGEAYR